MIGGDIITGVGGYISIWQPNQKASAPGTNGTRMDVSDWQVKELFVNAECTTTGCLGALNYRRVAVGFKFWCRLPFDLNQPNPKVFLKNQDSIALRFNIGNPDIETLNGRYTQANWSYYYSPAALAEEVSTISNAAKDVIRQEVIGVGTSFLFLCGGATGNDESQLLQTYLQAVASRGWSQ
ncbi:MAG: hypothetical protein WC479_10960 [Candidatus Izemoplasmatales bacterium]|jgi:hypothetical protein